MDGSRFDNLIRSLTKSRRSLLGGSLAMATGWLGVSASDARKKRKRKRKRKKKEQPSPLPPTTPPPPPPLPQTPNEYGCFEVGDPCTSAADCCSSICEGNVCRAHDTGICSQDKPGVCSATTTDVPTFVCGNDCYCFHTTAGSNYCAVPPAAVGSPKCADCKKDADCLALGYPSGSACVPVALGHCSGRCASGMACLVPCGVEYPDPIS